MNRISSIAVILLATVGLAASPRDTHAQKLPNSGIATSAAVTLKTFTPVDSLFVNPTVSQFNIALKHTVSGAPTEYRVSRFADFRDASWVPYNPSPSLVVPRTWFPPSGTDGTSQ